MIAGGLGFATETIQPLLVVEIEPVLGVLAGIQVGEVGFGQAEVTEREAAGIGMKADLGVAIGIGSGAHRDTALLIDAAELGPVMITGLDPGTAVGGKVEIAVVVAGAGDGNDVPGAGIARFEIGQVGHRRRRRFVFEEFHENNHQ